MKNGNSVDLVGRINGRFEERLPLSSVDEKIWGIFFPQLGGVGVWGESDQNHRAVNF